MDISILAWIGFGAFVLLMLALDLGVFHRRCHVVTFREAMTWSAVWIGLALAFNGLVTVWKGPDAGMQFLTAYLIEKSLSVDNVFVFATVFALFSVPAAYQHRVLFWGVFGALAMRGVFIFAGIALIERFHWILYVFGALLIGTAVKMFLVRDRQFDPEGSFFLRIIRRWIPVTSDYVGSAFIVRREGRLWATPLLLVLLLIEMTDVVFAVDSVPAILAVSRDPFIVYTSNVFAMLGLRSLYFALAGLMDRFRYLHAGVATILAFVGGKLMLIDVWKVPNAVSLSVVGGVLAVSMMASILASRRETRDVKAEPAIVPATAAET